jgi:hypothetical protein
MKICRFCEKVIGDQDEICGNCGYNPQTDTMTAAFVKKESKKDSGRKEGILSPGVKTFVIWGMAVVIFSLGIKYQGKLGDILWKVKNTILGNRVAKSSQVPEKTKPIKAIRLIDVRSYKASVDKTAGKNRRIEGIFYDPQGKSYVMINGQLISEKGNFGNMVIEKINRNSVEVVEDGNHQVLTVNK